MNEEIHRHMQPHLGDAEKLTTAELHAQLRQLDPKSMQCRVYNYEIARRKLQTFKRRSPYLMVGIALALAISLAVLVLLTSRMLEKGRARHLRIHRPPSEVPGNIP